MKYIPFCLVFGWFMLGCDDGNFSPFTPNQNHFSMFGFLDVRSDTQFVRIMKLNQTPAYTKKPYNISAYIENVQTKQQFPLQEKITRDAANNPIHLYWTTQKLVLGASYQIVADGGNGKVSTAHVEMPKEASSIKLEVAWNPRNPSEEYPQYVILTQPQNLVKFNLTFFLRDPRSQNTFTRDYTYYRTTFDLSGNPAFVIRATDLLEEITGNQYVSHWNLQVNKITTESVSSDQPIPDWQKIEDYALDSKSSNVKNGLGLILTGSREQQEWHELVQYLQAWLRTRG